MEEQLITKKELLQITGISYGSLYRWKRKKLIPDEWFIHRATYTGQETFFPREKILERIQKIMNLKDGMSLDDIAETFSPVARKVETTAEEAVNQGIAPAAAAELYVQVTKSRGPYDFGALFGLYLLGRLLQEGKVIRDEAVEAVKLVLAAESPAGKELLLLRKMGVGIFLLAPEGAAFAADEDTNLALRLPLSQWMAQLKEKLGTAGLETAEMETAKLEMETEKTDAEE